MKFEDFQPDTKVTFTCPLLQQTVEGIVILVTEDCVSILEEPEGGSLTIEKDQFDQVIQDFKVKITTGDK